MYESVSSIYRPIDRMKSRMHVQIRVSLIPHPFKIFANFFRFFENYGLTNHLHHPIMQLNRTNRLRKEK